MAGAVVVALGGAVLAGWAIDAQSMISLMPGVAATPPITAICLMIAGAAVWGVARGERRWALAGIPLLMIGMMTLYQYGADHDLGIDGLLFAAAWRNGTDLQAYPGRMAELTAVLVVLLAVVMAMVARGGWLARPAYWLATAGVTACGIVLAGYLAGRAGFRSMGLGLEMALPTAAGLAGLFAALASLAAAPRDRRRFGVTAAAQRAITALVPLRRAPLWLRVAGGVALPFAALAVRALLGGFDNQSPMSQFVPAVVLSAFLLGPGAGAITVVTSTFLGRFMFAPFGLLAVASPRAEGVLLAFLFSFLIVAVAIDLLFSTLDRVESDAAALRRQASLIDQSHDAILAWAPDGSIMHWSLGAERLYGHAAADAIGRNRHDLLASVPPTSVADIHAAMARDGGWVGDSAHSASDGRRLVVESRHTLVTDANGAPLVLETNRDLTAKRAAERRAADMELRLAAIVDALPIGILVCEAPSGRIVLSNRAVETMLRHPVLPTSDLSGYRAWESYHADGRRVEPEDYPLGQVLATGRRAEGEYRYRRGDSTDAWVRIVGAPICDVDGALVGGVVGIVDVDAERRLLEHQQLLMAELSHRVKNMLAVVQGIASSTLRRSASLDDFSVAFEGRLQALSTAHTQLLRTDWRGAQLRGLAEAVLAPHAAGDRLTIAGCDVALDARQGVSLALVLHELSTNAARHGALAQPDGRIGITWEIQSADTVKPRLHLRWTETGLPARPSIGRNGLGMRLITRTVEGDLGGRIQLQLGDQDLCWVMEFDLQSNPEPAAGD
jgi:PAS domain S-box-containing protein